MSCTILLTLNFILKGNTYAYVIEQSEKEFMKQWAKIVVTLERAVPQADAQKYLEEYSIGLGPSDDPRYEQRGVMVIKTKSKTRAKQRKGAVSNWKWVLKTTLGELKKRGMTGEEMRRLMWGRASITSPKKVSKKYVARVINFNRPYRNPFVCFLYSFLSNLLL
jgi:transient receptor potential cation channel subfamily V member 6